jgi:ATP-dependent Clp protease ATP-binding subunit ClpC
MYRWERFTERAKRVLQLAEEEAKRAKHSYIGTEHLLVGLLGDEGGLATVALSNLGVEMTRVRVALRGALTHPDQRTAPEPIPTSRVRRVIEIAFDEPMRLERAKVGTEQLLLALLKEGQGIGAQVLTEMGITIDRARAELERLRGQSSGEN